jgi:hypothetical protein
MVYFLKGRLPWQGIPGDTKEEKYRKIGEMKAAYRLDLLCEGLPGEILKFLEHVRALEFKEKPNYHYLRSLLLDIFTFDFDYHYDWTPPEVQVQVQHGLGLGI